MSDLPFTCGCGLVHTTATWAALPLVGYHCAALDALGPEDHLELRNCPCGSTKGVTVPADHDGTCEARPSGSRATTRRRERS